MKMVVPQALQNDHSSIDKYDPHNTSENAFEDQNQAPPIRLTSAYTAEA